MDIAWVEDQQEFEQSPNAKIAVQYAVAYQYEHREEADHHGVVIPDEFCEGSFCSRLYEEIAKRKKKICEKLQVDEDLDLEHIINCMEDFTRYMSTIVWNYVGELVFNLLVLVGAIKASDRIVREMMGLGG